MSRMMLALIPLLVLSGCLAWGETAQGQFPYEAHAPLANFARYHGFGYGPGYHNPVPRSASQGATRSGPPLSPVRPVEGFRWPRWESYRPFSFRESRLLLTRESERD
jgi:hypothetical protein